MKTAEFSFREMIAQMMYEKAMHGAALASNAFVQLAQNLIWT